MPNTDIKGKTRNNNGYSKLITDYGLIIVGTLILASSVTVFYAPNKVITGGISGLCIIVASYVKGFFGIDISLSVLSILFNLPLLVVGYKVLGKNFIWRTVFATVLFSVSLEIMSYLPTFVGDYFIVSVFGGVLTGAGVGLNIRSAATTGGSDLFATIAHKISKRISVANAMLAFDAAVILAGILIFGIERGLYAIISVFIASKVVDGILEGMSYSKGVFIISKQAEEIADDIMKQLDRGVTGLSGKGMYTKDVANVLMCIVAKKEIVMLKNIVKSRDEGAFMFVTDVRETFGNGFEAH